MWYIQLPPCFEWFDGYIVVLPIRNSTVKVVDCVWNVMAHAQKPDFVFRRNGRVRLNRQERQDLVQSTTGSRGVRISGSNAGYTMFRGSVKSTGYPLHSPGSPSLPLPCVTVCHHTSTGFNNNLTVTACVIRLSAVTLKRCVLLTKGTHNACLQMFFYETCRLEGAIYWLTPGMQRLHTKPSQQWLTVCYRFLEVAVFDCSIS